MNYSVQRFDTPDGTAMVILSAADFERLLAQADDAEDTAIAEAALARIEAGEGTMPGEVLDAMLDDGLTAVAAWRRYRGLSQSDLAAKAGLSQVFVSKIERGESHGVPRTRKALAEALDAPLWSLDEDHRWDVPDEIAAAGRYWIYENLPNNYACVHAADCSHCNDGQGTHPGSTNANGQWIGPFRDRAEAQRKAHDRGRGGASDCGHCRSR